MTDEWITLGLYAVGIIGGIVIGHEIAKDKWKTIFDAQFEINERQILMLRDLRKQLAKFHMKRDERGRFLPKNKI